MLSKDKFTPPFMKIIGKDVFIPAGFVSEKDLDFFQCNTYKKRDIALENTQNGLSLLLLNINSHLFLTTFLCGLEYVRSFDPIMFWQSYHYYVNHTKAEKCTIYPSLERFETVCGIDFDSFLNFHRAKNQPNLLVSFFHSSSNLLEFFKVYNLSISDHLGKKMIRAIWLQKELRFEFLTDTKKEFLFSFNKYENLPAFAALLGCIYKRF